MDLKMFEDDFLDEKKKYRNLVKTQFSIFKMVYSMYIIIPDNLCSRWTFKFR